MNYEEAKERFIQTWGAMGSNWGVSRTMSQIHALLLTKTQDITTDDIMEELGLSRGNVSMSLKALQEWGLVYRGFKAGERKDFFRAEKDIEQIAIQIAKERKKRELDPMIQVLDQIKRLEIEDNNEEKLAFKNTLENIYSFAKKSDRVLSTFVTSDRTWFGALIKKIFV